MKRTEYIVMTYYSMTSGTVWKRVYVDKDGKRYIRVKNGYQCIEGTPCIDSIMKD